MYKQLQSSTLKVEVMQKRGQRELELSKNDLQNSSFVFLDFEI